MPLRRLSHRSSRPVVCPSFLAAAAFGETGATTTGAVSMAVLRYASHNVVSALAANPAGHVGDRRSTLRVLVLGYGLGVITNVAQAFSFHASWLLVIAIFLSGVYIAEGGDTGEGRRGGDTSTGATELRPRCSRLGERRG